MRPRSNAEKPFDTKSEYCHYDRAHKDYLYEEEWSKLIINLLQSGSMSRDDILQARRKNESWDTEDYI